MEMILKPNEKQMETLTKVSKITGVDYDGLEWGQDITPDSLIEALEDMVVNYNRLEEKLEDTIQDRNENWKQKPLHYED